MVWLSFVGAFKVTELVGGETLSPEYRPGLDKVTPSQSRVSDLETPPRKQDNVNDLFIQA